MNYQENVCKCKKRCCSLCPASVLGFFIVLLVFAVGLMLGANFSALITPAMAAILAFTAAIAAITIGIVIYCWCRRSE